MERAREAVGGGGDQKYVDQLLGMARGAAARIDDPAAKVGADTAIELNTGRVALERGDFQGAIEHCTRARDLAARLQFPDGADTNALGCLSDAQGAAGQNEAGAATLALAQARYEQLDDDAGLMRVLANLSDALRAAGHCDRAVPLYRRTAIVGAKTGQKDFATLAALTGEGACLAIGHRAAAGIARLTQALAVAETFGDPTTTAQVRSELAKALALGGDRAKALAAARTAAAELDGRAPPAPAFRAQFEAWIAAQPR